MAKIGDTVRFLNTTGGGIIVKIEGNVAYVEDSDGFQTPSLLRECVVVNTDITKKSFFDKADEIKRSANAQAKAPEITVVTPAPSKEIKEEIPIEETATGNKMNVVIAFEPVSVKKLDSSRFDMYIVNDSNYFMDFTLMARGDGMWHVVCRNTVEPNIQLSLGSVSHEDLPEMTQIAFQAVAYKTDKDFDIKNPINYRHKLDVTRFYKLHTFRESDYFDTPVFEIPIVVDDVPQRQVEINPEEIAGAMKGKQERQPVKHTSKPSEKRSRKVEVVDLHIHELLDNTVGLSNADMLGVQMDRFRKEMDAAAKHPGSRIVFIHGKGEGVLRKAITDELKRRYPRCEWHDASFREYGFGATEVCVR